MRGLGEREQLAGMGPSVLAYAASTGRNTMEAAAGAAAVSAARSDPPQPEWMRNEGEGS
jgi:hypothetical protein